VVLYERIYADPSFGLPSARALRPAGCTVAFHFQVPSYWANFHKNPETEPFNEDHDVRPRGVRLLQRSLQLITGMQNMLILSARRLEHSGMLQDYVAVKTFIRCRTPGVSQPGLVKTLLLTAEQYKAWCAAGLQNAFSQDIVEHDINEVYLWAGVPPGPDGKAVDIRAAAALARRCRLLFGNPLDALAYAPAARDGHRSLLLCRAVCGELSSGEAHRKPADCLVTAASPSREATTSGRAMGYRFNMLHGDRQIYPEILLHVVIAPDRSQSGSM